MSVKSKSLNMRISESDKQTLHRAASILGVNLTSFVLQSAMNKAQETLDNEKRIELTKRDMKRLLEIMDSTEPDENLSEAFAHYNAKIS
ncbi:MAG: DUF1778 domain-containing protein [Balneolaceae bacterium]|nr:DUF1778 domain-containing protein [Balneolaceae bacterium]MDR9407618.1 DUF1778 domain-containing protein [Balneolaceae bacterium]